VSCSSIKFEDGKVLAMPIAADFHRLHDPGPAADFNEPSRSSYTENLVLDVVAARKAEGGKIECRAFLPDLEILDPIDSIYAVHCSSKKDDEDEESQGRNHNAEAYGDNDHRVEWGSVGDGPIGHGQNLFRGFFPESSVSLGCKPRAACLGFGTVPQAGRSTTSKPSKLGHLRPVVSIANPAVAILVPAKMP
jgi:hypothetical protein